MSSPSKKVFVIFPCFNEEEGLEKLLGRFNRVMSMSRCTFNFVIVNDGSLDRTHYVAESFSNELSIQLITFKKNQGVETVFNTAFGYIIKHISDDDIIITMDSDNTMNPFVILDMLKLMNNADIVVASRFVRGGKMIGAGYRTVMSYCASWLMRFGVGVPNLTDYSIFFRSYRGSVIRKLFEFYNGHPVSGEGFSCMANLIIRAHYLCPNIRIQEVPLTLRYDLKESGSKIKILRTIMGYLKLVFLYRRYVGAVPIDRTLSKQYEKIIEPARLAKNL